MGLRTCEDVQRSDLAMLLKRFGKFGRVLWERSQGIDDRSVTASGCVNPLALNAR
jgi:DNA polymerase-4